MRLHIGVYAYRPQALATYVATPVSELEELEGLEQLRFLAAGIPIDVVEVETPPFTLRELNNPEDVAPIEDALAAAGLDMSSRDTLDPKYSVILCDIWGVVHDGVHLYPDAAERLRHWRGQGRKIILITNAPRTAEAVEAQLDRIGLPRDCWDGIATSGEAGIAALSRSSPIRPASSAPRQDRAILEGTGSPSSPTASPTLPVTGLDGERTPCRRLSPRT